MSNSITKTLVLYKNSQWMVQDEPRGKYVVEINPDDPDDLEGRYWFHTTSLGHRGHNSTIMHMAEKNWVNLQALQEAVKFAIDTFNIRTDYDVDQEFFDAFQYRSKISQLKPMKRGLHKPSEIPDIDGTLEAIGKE